MSAFVDTVAKLAKTLSGALSGGAIPAVIEIGKDVLDLIEKSKDVVNNTDAAQLTAIRDELEPKVMAHATATEKSLRGSE